MDLKTKLKGLYHLGAGNVARSVTYARQRDRLDAKVPHELPDPSTMTRPEGPPRASTTRGGAIFEFEDATMEVVAMAPDMVRVTWTPGALPVPYMLARPDAEPWDGVEVALEGLAEGLAGELVTPELTIRVHQDGSVEYLTGAGRLREDLPPLYRGGSWRHRARLGEHERLFGLGERNVGPDLRGQSLTMWNTEPNGSYRPGDDPIYICVPTYVGLTRVGSYLVFFENSHPAEFSFVGREAGATFLRGALRYYLVPGPLPRAMERYGGLTGRPPMPPRWALGLHQSRWSYMDSREVREVAEGYARHQIPLSAIHLDIHYMDQHRVFTLDRERFPDLPGLSEELLSKHGVRLVMNHDPGVHADQGFELYRDGLSKGVFCRLPGGDPAKAPVWPGWCVFPDFTDPAARRWWGERYSFFVDNGVAGVWHDMNEPAAFAAWGRSTLPLPTRHSMEGRGGDHLEAHNLYALLELRAAAEALVELVPDRRPWLLTRSGTAGIQRYAWTWTGDSESTWDALRLTVGHVIGLGMSGVQYSGPDVGGFGGHPDDELMVRWVQAACLMPFFRIHSAVFVPRREPWRFGESTLSTIREHALLRSRLMPYLYTLAWQAHTLGWPLVRPMSWLDEADQRLAAVTDQFMVGDDLLVAPVLSPGVTSRRVLLPKGTWYNLWTGRAVEGGREVTLPAPLDRLPVLARGGSIIPTEHEGRAILDVYWGEPMRRAMVYHDPGDGPADGSLETFTWERRRDRVILSVERDGEHPTPDWFVRVHGLPLARATVDGRDVPVSSLGLMHAGRFETLEVVIG